MRKTMLTLLLALAPAAAIAQQPANPPPVAPVLPREVQHMVVDRWNGVNEYRASDRAEIGDSTEVHGNISVLRGPLTLGGHVTGSVLVINGDVILHPSARVDGDLIVVGGDVEGRSRAHISGATLIYRQTLAYREEGDRIVALDSANGASEGNWWRRLERRHAESWSEAFRVVQAGAYNRVEGLPVQVGPVMERLTPWGSVHFDAAAILRTGSTFQGDRADVGNLVRTEVRIGHDHGVGIGGQIYNTVDPVESWKLSDLETALAAFVSRRDYRDYYQRHGGLGSLTLYGARSLSLTGSFGEERWSSRVLKNPFTLFNANRDWRDNPAIDQGLFRIGDLNLRFDTRNDPDDPGAGWYLNADVEHGRGRISTPGVVSGGTQLAANSIDDYTRAFLDMRRYNRVGPNAQLDMRLVLAGWVAGDELPLSRRLSVDGPGALPGFGFRSERAGADVGNCNSGVAVPGTPAECDRIALAQVEYRGNVKVPLPSWLDLSGHYQGSRSDISWVLFADGGRGWRVNGPENAPLTYDATTLPAFSTFRTDMGIGIDVAGIGFYAVKALSSPSEPMKFFVRLRHRF